MCVCVWGGGGGGRGWVEAQPRSQCHPRVKGALTRGWHWERGCQSSFLSRQSDRTTDREFTGDEATWKRIIWEASTVQFLSEPRHLQHGNSLAYTENVWIL